MIKEGRLVDIHQRRIYPARIEVLNGKISQVVEIAAAAEEFYILTGLIDAHVHIESSMLTPGSFAQASVPHGTIGSVSDPHEIANVLGIEGVNFMIEDGKKTPFRFYFGAPSCVPATTFESGGAYLGPEKIEELLARSDIKYLAEMMNFPGVVSGEKEVMEKLSIASKFNKPVDGHAPGLKGDQLRKYIAAGITTDHECSSMEEAIEKILLGMKVIIREGSAARNLAALSDLYNIYPEMLMLSSDDIHPEMLEKRHLEKLIADLLEKGYDIFNVLRSATINPVEHYNLDAGLLRAGDPADFIIVEDIKSMKVLETWIAGEMVFDRGKVLFDYIPALAINKFICSEINKAEIVVANQGGEIRVITAFDGEIFTKESVFDPGNSSYIEADLREDILKIVVKDRYGDQPPAVGFIKGFGLKTGAFASSVAHDSHNIICIGTNDDDIVSAINEIICMKGGLAFSSGKEIKSLRLDIAGIMTTASCTKTASDYEKLTAVVRDHGCVMSAPFMTLSFMALLVIPELKLSDQGLFDGKAFRPVTLFI